MNSDLLRPEQAAEYLNVATQTLAVWRLRGTGPAFVKIGRKVNYERSVLEAFKFARTYVSTAEY